MEIIFGILFGGIPVVVGLLSLKVNNISSACFGVFASFLMALIIEGNHK